MSDTALPNRAVLRPGPALLAGILPGLLLTGLIAAASYLLHDLRGVAVLSPMILAIVLGMLFHNLVGTPLRAKAGIAFSCGACSGSRSSCSACS